MSGHSKWHSIKHKKAATDAARGKILTKHSKLIAVAARNDPNPDTNPNLRAAITNAKSEGVPKDNIERILKKMSGGDKNAANFEEQIYEGFGPGGIAFIVTALTDNVNRTFPAIKTVFTKNGGSLGSSGSVNFLFDKIGVISVENNEKTEDELFEIAIDVGAENIEFSSDGVSNILTKFTDLGSIRDKISEKLIIKKAEPQYRAKDPKIITDKALLEKIEKFIEHIENTEDVNEIFGAFDIE